MNLENRLQGWVDVPSAQEEAEATAAGDKLVGFKSMKPHLLPYSASKYLTCAQKCKSPEIRKRETKH